MKREGLLLIDVQEAMVTGALYREAETLAAMQTLLAAAREQEIAVVHIRHDYGEGHVWARGTPGWQIHAPLAPLVDEMVIDKTRNSAFYRTSLDTLLRERGIDTVVVCGVHTEFCIDATIRAAFDREYGVIVPREANSSEGNAYMDAARLHAYYNSFLWPRRYAQVIGVEEAVRGMRNET